MLSKEDEKLLKRAAKIIAEYTKSKRGDLLPQMVSIRKALLEIEVVNIPFECENVPSERILCITNSLGNIILENAKEIIF